MPPRWPRGRTSRRFARAGGRPLEDDLPEEEDERPRDVEAVREERAVAGVRALLGVHPADRQDHVVGLAREEVAAARAAVAQQPAARSRAAARSRRSRPAPSRPSASPVSFSTQRNAGMSSFEPSRMPAWLAPVCEERSVSHSASAVRALREPARHRRRVAVAHRALQHRQREAVDLEEDDPRRVGDRRARRSGARSAGSRGACTCRRRSCPGRRRARRRPPRRRAPRRERRPERVDLEVAVGDAVGREQHQRVERRARAGSR